MKQYIFVSQMNLLMRRVTSIHYKAMFLALVFSLNAIVGFACSLGVDMGFNHVRDIEHQEPVMHVHADGSKHEHKKHHEHKHEKENHKDNCCTHEVTKVVQADKTIPSSFQLINPGFLTSFIATFYQADLTNPEQANISSKYFVRGYHPPIRDIRIAIQSFQI